MVSGTLKSGNATAPISRGRLRGDQIRFAAGDSEYLGRVGDKAIEGVVKSGGNTGTWRASR